MKKETLVQVIIIIVLTIILAGFLIYGKIMNKNINSNERMPFENKGQMQRTNEDRREPPTKSERDFRLTIQNDNI